MSNNLFPIWVKDEISNQEKMLRNLSARYLSIENKDTDYAKGIKQMIDLRQSIVKLIKTQTNE
jgi:hypothetical protein